MFETGSHAGINPAHGDKLTRILARLNVADRPEDMDAPAFKLHPLKGDMKKFWLVSVNGNWRLVFRFVDGHAYDVDLLDYH